TWKAATTAAGGIRPVWSASRPNSRLRSALVWVMAGVQFGRDHTAVFISRLRCRYRIAPLDRWRVPDLHHPIGPRRDEHAAVGGAEGHAANSSGVAGEGEDLLAVGHVPDLHHLVAAARHEAGTVGMESQGEDGMHVATEGGDDPTGGRI